MPTPSAFAKKLAAVAQQQHASFNLQMKPILLSVSKSGGGPKISAFHLVAVPRCRGLPYSFHGVLCGVAPRMSNLNLQWRILCC